jgi:hypothetical protein
MFYINLKSLTFKPFTGGKTLGRPYKDFGKTLTVGWGGGLWEWEVVRACVVGFRKLVVSGGARDGEECPVGRWFREGREGLWETGSDVIVFPGKRDSRN